MILRNILGCLVLALAFSTGCDSHSDMGDADESAGEEMEEAADDMGDSMEEAGDEVEESM